MRIKSFFAGTVEAALNEARRELGPEAILIESRRARPESRRLGAYEVVCALASPKDGAGSGGNPAAQESPFKEARSAPRPVAADPLGQLNESIATFLERLDGLTRRLHQSEFSALRLGASAEAVHGLDLLEAAEVESGYASEILKDATAPGASWQEALSARIGADCRLGNPRASRKVVAVIGPPGAGKTTTLVKLAARYGLGARRPSLILSVDTQRVASSEPLRAYSSILGAGFQALETPRALAQALQEYHGKEWIWIDTPGLSRKEMVDAQELAEIFRNNGDIDTHLVLPASMRAPDLARTVDQFRAFRPSKLLFTRLDETAAYGALLNESARTGLPVSFLSDGSQIPEDLQEASVLSIANLILGETAAAQTDAAPTGRAASAAA